MTKNETIQVLQSIEDRAVDFPHMTACDWVAIAAAKRHLTNSNEVEETQEEPVSKSLEEAAKDYSSNLNSIYGSIGEQTRNAFKAGAKWQKEQLMKEAIDAMVHIDAGNYPYIPQIELYDYGKDIPLAKGGDKYKVILIKED